jgi:tryptophanyl-tRNA synthetase
MLNAKFVPVGLDQKQHVEMARDIAKAFNKTYGNTFVMPTEVIKEEVATIAGTDGRKMSKSYNNVIPLFCEEAKLKKLVSGIVTDSSLPNEPKSTDCALFKLYKLFGSDQQIKEYAKKFETGISWADAKKELFELMNSVLAPMREKYNYYMEHYDEVEKILEEGSAKARVIAKETLNRARQAIGL